MKRFFVVVLTLALVACFAVFAVPGVVNGETFGGDQAEKVINAKVRYFDGTAEMIELKDYDFINGFARLVTVYGDVIYIGPNNVIIIEEGVNR